MNKMLFYTYLLEQRLYSVLGKIGQDALVEQVEEEAIRLVMNIAPKKIISPGTYGIKAHCTDRSTE
jgi:hypothetical protein